jgi:lipopolysaccharide biosynthesis glycosyltransferase
VDRRVDVVAIVQLIRDSAGGGDSNTTRFDDRNFTEERRMPTKVLYLAVDRAMFPPALFTAYTARRHSRAQAFDIVIAVPENSIEPEWLDWACSHIDVNVKEVRFADYLGIDKTSNPMYPPSCCYRYLFDLFIGSGYEKIIYLDADIRVAGDLSRLFDLDLGIFAFAARPGLTTAHDIIPGSWRDKYLRTLEWDIADPYASSGVLVINPERWLGLDFGRRVINFLQNNLEKCLLPDESALNLLIRGEFLPISPVWNMLTTTWLQTDVSDLLCPAVLHHGGNCKPWKVTDWTLTTGDRHEAVHYQRFSRNSPLLGFVSGERLSWKGAKKYAKAFVRRRLGGTIDPLINLKKYRSHIETFWFADKAQGLIACDVNGVLRVVD